MMKLKSVILPLVFIFSGSSTLAMEQNPPAAPAQTPPPTNTTTQAATLKTPWFGIPLNVQTNFVSNGDVQKGMQIAEEFNKTARSAIDKTEQITDSLNSVGKGIVEAGKGISNVGDGFKEVAASMKDASTNVQLAMDNTAKTIDSGVKNLTQNVKEATADFVKTTDNVSTKLEILQKGGLKVAPETIAELNKSGVSLMKTCLTAGIGGAIALAGIILFYKTFMDKKSDENTQEDNRPLYQRILTNRYLISALLMFAGTGIILKSDKIVTAVS
jgi:hypothetical protein